jgi:hypothetical protein
MNRWLDIALVVTAVFASAGYAVYALGPKRIKNAYSRLATKYLGLRAARWFSKSAGGHSCNNCSANPAADASKHDLRK